MPPTFGRMDAFRGSSVEITEIIDYTKRHENRCVGAPGMDVLSTLTFGLSNAQVLISGAFCVQFYVRFEEIKASSQCCIIAHPLQATIQLKINPPANQRIARSLLTPHCKYEKCAKKIRNTSCDSEKL